MRAVAGWIVLSTGWPRRLAALVAGAIGALALAPVDLPFALLVPMTAAVWLIDGSARGETSGLVGRALQPRGCLAAAAVGWWWGFGYFLAGFWWLGAAFLVEPGKDAWAMPFGVLGVPAMLAVFPACGFALSRLLWTPGRLRILALVAGLGLSEWLRAHLFTGFPWNNYGMAFGDNLVLAQIASIVGNPGLTVLAIAVCAAPATLADARPTNGATPSRTGWLPTVLAGLAVVALAGFGAVRLARGPVPAVPDVHLRIVQPNVAQDSRFTYANKDAILADYLSLSDRATAPEHPGMAGVTHLVWPESAFPFILNREPDALEAIGKALPAGAVLITGAARVGTAHDDGRDRPAYFNAVEVIGSGGSLLESYDKVHLVPFGEYLPFDALLRRIGVTHFVHVPGGFTPGPRHRLIDVPGLPPVAPLICYESIFSGETLPTASTDERARTGVILNVTNDGWFGRTSGPYQHFAQARLRSIEYGLPLVRAANTGITAVVDPYGRIVASLPLGARNVLDSTLPARINPTIYSCVSQFIEPLVYIVMLCLGLLTRFITRLRVL